MLLAGKTAIAKDDLEWAASRSAFDAEAPP